MFIGVIPEIQPSGSGTSWAAVLIALIGLVTQYFSNQKLQQKDEEQEKRIQNSEKEIVRLTTENNTHRQVNVTCKKRCSSFALVVSIYRKLYGRHESDTLQLHDPSDGMIEPTRPLTGQPLLPPAGKVLIVEDDRTSRKALAGLMRLAGFSDVNEASTVADALAGIEDRPAFVILDLMLPDGDGLDVLRRVRMMGMVDCRVVVCSATEDPERLVAIKALAPFSVLPKPITGAEAIYAAMGIDQSNPATQAPAATATSQP